MLKSISCSTYKWNPDKSCFNWKSIKYPSRAYWTKSLSCLFFYRYGSLAKAAAKPDGLAVLGTFFHIQKEDNSVLSDLTKKLQQIQEPNEISENLSGLSLASFIPPMGSKTTEFFRYEGSLTTPGCYESVTWTVFRHSLAISEEQMASFRALYDGQGQPLVNNFRPVQPLNGR